VSTQLPALPLAPSPASDVQRPGATITRERYAELATRVRRLSWISLGLMSIEGLVAVAAGILAGSIALIGFGLDSFIEGAASVVLIWRMSGPRVFSQDAENRAQRLVALQFFLLGPYVAFESVRSLVNGDRPEETLLGIGLATASVIVMPILGIAKQRLADEIGSAATRGEGRQNMLCAYLAAALLIGLLANAFLGAWWLDAVVGLLIAAVAVAEGLDSWRGDGCCVASPLDGLAVDGQASACCDDDRCR
jgi:divalent metal cation (Fe/Co/Zn/Cd) transporter